MSRTFRRVLDSILLMGPLFICAAVWLIFSPKFGYTQFDPFQAVKPYIDNVRLRVPIVLFAMLYPPAFVIVFGINPLIRRVGRGMRLRRLRAWRRRRAVITAQRPDV